MSHLDSPVLVVFLARCSGRPRLIRSVLRASKFSVLKLIEVVILWVYCTIPLSFGFFRHILALFLKFYNYFLWRRITDEGSISEMRIWSILLIKSDLKWCLHLSRSLFLNFTRFSTVNSIVFHLMYGQFLLNTTCSVICTCIIPTYALVWFAVVYCPLATALEGI